jgi:hypothetical protein
VDTVEAPAVVVTWAAHDALGTRYSVPLGVLEI